MSLHEAPRSRMPNGSSSVFSETLSRQLVAMICAAFPLERDTPPPAPLSAEMWRALYAAAREHGLVGLLHGALRQLQRADVPDDLRVELEDNVRCSALARALIYHELELTADAATHAGIPFIVLKGAALAKSLYPDPAQRSFGDLDLLIREHDANAMRALLLTRGLQENREMTEGFHRAYYGEMGFSSPRSNALAVDVHWGLVTLAYYRRRMDVEWFWQNWETLLLANRELRILNPTAQLVHLAAHLGLHHQDKPRLIWLYDLALLVTHRRADLDWHAADGYAKRAGLARPIRYALEAMRAWWGVPLPAETAALFEPPRHDLAERIVYALTTTKFPEARTLSDVLATPGTRAKIDFARQQLFPDAAYMRTRYHITYDALLPLYYARRLVESVFKFTRSLWAAATR